MVAEIARSEGKPMDKKAAYRASSSTILTVQPNALKQGQIFDMAAGWRNWRPRRGGEGADRLQKGLLAGAYSERGENTAARGVCVLAKQNNKCSSRGCSDISMPSVPSYSCLFHL